MEVVTVWRLWQHKKDFTVRYEAREVNQGYEFRYPGGKDVLGWQRSDIWRGVYEPAKAKEEA